MRDHLRFILVKTISNNSSVFPYYAFKHFLLTELNLKPMQIRLAHKSV